MERLTEKVHQILRMHLRQGDVAIDATAGNGHDTLFLAHTVGPQGWVYAFDVQSAAIANTHERLTTAGCKNVTLFKQDHAKMATFIPREHHGRIAAVTFNLGYLPGSDKSSVTQARSTSAAMAAALSLLRAGGVLAVLAYTGHPGGLEEAEAVAELLQSVSPDEFAVEQFSTDRPQAPRLFVVIRQEKSGRDKV
jgi:predicted methyltransferase